MSTEVTFRKIDDYYILDQLNTAQLDAYEYSKLSMINQLIFHMDLRDYDFLHLLFGQGVNDWDLGDHFHYPVRRLLKQLSCTFDKFEILKNLEFIYIIDFFPYFDKLFIHGGRLYRFEDGGLKKFELLSLQPVEGRITDSEFLLTMKNEASREIFTHRVNIQIGLDHFKMNDYN